MIGKDCVGCSYVIMDGDIPGGCRYTEDDCEILNYLNDLEKCENCIWGMSVSGGDIICRNDECKFEEGGK